MPLKGKASIGMVVDYFKSQDEWCMIRSGCREIYEVRDVGCQGVLMVG
jgi:hypothetical protein